MTTTATREATPGRSLEDGRVVAIAGPPNAGKSTLLNRLARREAAIVSPYAGTTRDVIEVHLDLNGLPVTLLDTAGIRETRDPVEMEGVRRARDRAAAADVVLWVVDASEGGEAGRLEAGRTSGPVAERIASGSMMAAGPGAVASGLGSPPVWLIRNKADLTSPFNHLGNSSASSSSEVQQSNEPIGWTIEHRFMLSSVTGQGLDDLVAALTSAADRLIGAAEPALVTRERHRLALEDARSALGRILAGSLAEDLLAEELRVATRALERLTGRIDVEDVLDVIFRDFCIGK